MFTFPVYVRYSNSRRNKSNSYIIFTTSFCPLATSQHRWCIPCYRLWRRTDIDCRRNPAFAAIKGVHDWLTRRFFDRRSEISWPGDNISRCQREGMMSGLTHEPFAPCNIHRSIFRVVDRRISPVQHRQPSPRACSFDHQTVKVAALVGRRLASR